MRLRSFNAIKVMAAIILALALSVCALNGVQAAEKKRYIGTTTDNLKIRKGPNTTATAIGSLPAGSVVELVASVATGKTIDGYTADKNFYKLSSGGYIAASYVKVTIKTTDEPQTTSNASVVIPNESQTPEPSDPGVEVIEVNTPTPTPKKTQAPASSANVKKMVATTNVNVRELPSTTAKVLRRISAGEYITIVKTHAAGETVSDIKLDMKWFKLNSGGYVSANYFKEIEITSAANASVRTTTYAVAISDATMYASPIIISDKKGTLYKGESKVVTATVKNGDSVGTIKSVVGTWYKLSNGYFIQGSKVSLTTKQDAPASATAANVTVNTTLNVGDGVSAKTNVNIRTGPGTEYGIKRLMVARETDVVESVIKDGSTFEGKKVIGTWISLLKSDGYVRVDYLSFDPGSTLVLE